MNFLVFYLLESLLGIGSCMRRNQSLCLRVMGLLLERDAFLVMKVIMFSSMGVVFHLLFQNEGLGNQHPWRTEERYNE